MVCVWSTVGFGVVIVVVLVVVVTVSVVLVLRLLVSVVRVVVVVVDLFALRIAKHSSLVISPRSSCTGGKL